MKSINSLDMCPYSKNLKAKLCHVLFACIFVLTAQGQSVPPLNVDLFKTYKHPGELYNLFGKHWEGDPIDLKFALKGPGGVDGAYLGDSHDHIMVTGGNLDNSRGPAWQFEIKGLRHIGDLKFAGYIPTYTEIGDFWYGSERPGGGTSNRYFTRNQFVVKTGIGDSALVFGTPAETYGQIGPDNYDILIDWGGAMEADRTLYSYSEVIEKGVDRLSPNSPQARQPSLTLSMAANGLWNIPNMPESLLALTMQKPVEDLAFKSVIGKGFVPGTDGKYDLRLQPMVDLRASSLNFGLKIINKILEYKAWSLKFPPIGSSKTFDFTITKVIHEKVGQDHYWGGAAVFQSRGGPTSIWPDSAAKGFGVEFSMATDPIRFNRFALEMINMGYPIPFAPGLFWQNIKGGVYNIQAYPWNVKAECLFSVGESQLPLVGYPASMFGKFDISANGYLFSKAGIKVFGVDGPVADLTFDPSQKFVRFRWKDLPLPFPFPLMSGEITDTAGNGSGHGTARIGIPKQVPIIGGLGIDAGVWHYDHRPEVKISKSTRAMKTRGLSAGETEFSAEVGLQIAKFIPRLCSPVKVTFNTTKKFAWWDSCYTRLFGACIPFLRVDFRNIVNVEWKEVCADPIPAKFGQFRVGLKLSKTQPVKAFFDPLGAYDSDENFYNKMYLADYPEWEVPFYYQHVDEMGRIAYYNYNWDRIHKEYSIADKGDNPFQPSKQLDANSNVHSVLIDKDYEYVVFRLNTENQINNVGDIELILPDDTELKAVENNLPFGYVETETVIVSKANSDAREVFFKIISPEKGDYKLHIHNRKQLGNYTFEVLNQNLEPVINYGEAEMAGNRDATISQTQIDILFEASDPDSDPENVLIGVYLDKNKQGYNGIEIEQTNLASITQGEPLRIETNGKNVASGYYYAYITVDDQRNIAQKFYLDGDRLFVQDDLAPEPVENIKVASTASGFDVSFEPSADHNSEFSYDIYVSPEFDSDNGGSTKSVYFEKFGASFDNLVVGEPYLVSVIAVDENDNKSYPKVFKRIVPGVAGKRPIRILGDLRHDATAGYHFNHQIKFVDGDILEAPNTLKDSSVLYEIIGDSEGASIDNSGMLSWLPTDQQIGNHTFKISITRLFVSGPDDTSLTVREPDPTVFELDINVLPSDNLNGLTNKSVDILSTPNFRVLEGELYSYPLSILNVYGDEKPMDIEILEGPDGMVYDENTQTILWQTNNEKYGTFVEIALVDEELHYFAKQRWFIDVISENTVLNDELTIVGIDISHKDPDLFDYVIHWNAPKGKYLIEYATSLFETEWTSMSDLEEPGGYQSVTGFRFNKNELPNNSDQLFIRIRSLND